MRFEWDESKRRLNISRHGIDFADLKKVFAGATVTMLDDRFDYGEDRFSHFGIAKRKSGGDLPYGDWQKWSDSSLRERH